MKHSSSGYFLTVCPWTWRHQMLWNIENCLGNDSVKFQKTGSSAALLWECRISQSLLYINHWCCVVSVAKPCTACNLCLQVLGRVNLVTGHVKTQLIAHDKEVYDIAFSRAGGGRDMFASVGEYWWCLSKIVTAVMWLCQALVILTLILWQWYIMPNVICVMNLVSHLISSDKKNMSNTPRIWDGSSAQNLVFTNLSLYLRVRWWIMLRASSHRWLKCWWISEDWCVLFF